MLVTQSYYFQPQWSLLDIYVSWHDLKLQPLYLNKTVRYRREIAIKKIVIDLKISLEVWASSVPYKLMEVIL